MRELNLYLLEFSYKGCTIKIRCSYKLLGVSVKKLGELLGEPKRSFPHKFASFETLNYNGPLPDATFFESEEEYLLCLKTFGHYFSFKEVSLEYAKFDVIIVYKTLEKIIEIGGGYRAFDKALSFSSYSYSLFRKKFDKTKITKNFLKVDEMLFIGSAYFGGRTEIFGNTRDGLVHRFDFPGMYGSCMQEKFPVGKPT